MSVIQTLLAASSAVRCDGSRAARCLYGDRRGRHHMDPLLWPGVRGGTANCGVALEENRLSRSGRADVLVVMNQPSLSKFLDRIKPGGCSSTTRTW